METFPALLVLCAGNSLFPVTRSFDVILSAPWISGWVNNREAGDWRRRRTHYDAIVMIIS